MAHEIRKAHGSWHPFSDFSELHYLQKHEPWLTGPLVQAQYVWHHYQHNRLEHTCYVVRRLRSRRTLVILLTARGTRDVYLRLHDNETWARTDAESLADEMSTRPPRVAGGQADVDGGPWCDTEDSLPDVDKIWYSGTFTKNPMTIACTQAMVDRLWQEGPALQDRLNKRAETLVDRLSIWLREHRVPISIARFGSMFRFTCAPPMTLLVPHLAMRGIYTAENMLFFVSAAHADDDLLALEAAVKDSLIDMRQGGYFT